LCKEESRDAARNDRTKGRTVVATTTDEDKSRNGGLIHEASSSGRWVKVVTYLEGVKDPKFIVEGSLVCRSSEQAAELARVLNEARFVLPTR
jgi:hypothetical protein